MATPFEEWASATQEVASDPIVLAPIIIIGFLLVFAGIAIFFVFRWWQKRQHYTQIGRPIDPVRIEWEGRFSGMEGYLSEVEVFTEEVFEQLALQEDLQVNNEIIKQLKNDGRLNIYHLNITDEGDTYETFNDTWIISPYDLKKLGYYDERGKRYIYALGDRIRRKNLWLLKTSAKYTITDDEGKEQDWWIISPKVEGETKEFVGFKGNKNFAPIKHVFETTVIEGGRRLAIEVSYATSLAKALAQNQEYKQKAKLFEQLHGEQISRAIAKHLKESRWKMGLTRHPYIVMTKEQFERDSGLGMVWIAVSGLITGVFGYVLPDLLPQIDPVSSMMLGWMVGILFGVLLFKLASDSQKKKALVDEAEERELNEK